MTDFPYYEPTPEEHAAEAAYWESEKWRHEVADWVEQQALALAEDGEEA